MGEEPPLDVARAYARRLHLGQLHQAMRGMEVQHRAHTPQVGMEIHKDHALLLLCQSQSHVDRHRRSAHSTLGSHKGEHLRLWAGRRRPGSPNHKRLHTSHQLGGMNGLGHVVIGPRFEARHLILHLPFGAEHQDGQVGCLGIGAQTAAHLNARHVGHHHIQDDQAGVLPFDGRERFPPTLGHDRLIPLHLKGVTDQP